MSHYYYYCPKCLDNSPVENAVCAWCNTQMIKTDVVVTPDLSDQVPLNALLDSPERREDPRFSQEAYEYRINYVPIEYGKHYSSAASVPTVKCPYCHSINTRKIGVGSKIVHSALFGVFSMGRNGKQWHCNSCGSDF